MKKLLLGCGIMLVLGLGTLGVIAYQVWPQWKEVMARSEEIQGRLLVLEESFPFEAPAPGALNAERFITFLGMRTEMKRELGLVMDEIKRMEEQAKQDELGTIDMMRLQLKQFPMVYDPLVNVLEARQMSLNELGYFVQVLWATLGNIDGGGGGGEPQLDQLRGLYPKLQMKYRDVVADDSPSLSDLVAHIDPATVDQTRAIMAADVELVQSGMLDDQLEAVCLALATGGFKVQMGPMTVDVGGSEDAPAAPDQP